MFVRRVLVGSSGLGIVGTGLWFLISHIKEARNRNWANGLIEDVKKLGVIMEKKKIEEIWDLEAIKWDSSVFKEMYENDLKENTSNNMKMKEKWGSWENARLAFFTKMEELKSKNKLKDAFDGTNYSGNWEYGLDEFLKPKTTSKKK